MTNHIFDSCRICGSKEDVNKWGKCKSCKDRFGRLSSRENNAVKRMGLGKAFDFILNSRLIKKDKCEICGFKHNLHIHHRDFNKHNNSIDNFIVLCFNCHMIIHSHKIDIDILKQTIKTYYDI